MRLANGDVLTGRVTSDPVAIQTRHGEMVYAFDDVRELQVVDEKKREVLLTTKSGDRVQGRVKALTFSCVPDIAAGFVVLRPKQLRRLLLDSGPYELREAGKGAIAASGAWASRFAYIVDVSGSMAQHRRMETCLREVMASIEKLPEHGYLYVVVYSSTHTPFKREWIPIDDKNLRRVRQWLGNFDPGGGSRPQPAFMEVLSLRDRPDVVYFLTDGQIEAGLLESVSKSNRERGLVTVHTVAVGDASGQALLERLASDTGGEFRFVGSP